jgi:2-keto-4-pentenoate hydratase/2-oxohepta-3-ene-1,7-dioic acid hydratase in catechol pathway
MNLVRFAAMAGDEPRPGLEIAGRVHDIGARYPTVSAFLAAHADGWDERSVDLAGLSAWPREAVRLGPPVDDGASIFLVGANYRKHAEEAGLDVPVTPVIFQKPTTALVGPGEPICLPPVSQQMDYEGELAVVIGRTARRVARAEASRYVAGLTVVNDCTARDLQWVQLGPHRIVDWLSSKALDRSTPIGPGIVAARSAGDPHRLKLTTRLNGQLMQDADTSLMVFDIWTLIEFLTARVTLRAGDVLSTGTPYGVGGFRKIFLKPGDRLRVEVEKVGVLENPVVQD